MPCPRPIPSPVGVTVLRCIFALLQLENAKYLPVREISGLVRFFLHSVAPSFLGTGVIKTEPVQPVTREHLTPSDFVAEFMKDSDVAHPHGFDYLCQKIVSCLEICQKIATSLQQRSLLVREWMACFSFRL